MTKNTLIAAVMASMVAGTLAAPAFAQATGDRADRAHHQRDGHRGHGGRANQMRGFFDAYDANDDGDLTQAEIDSVRAARLAEFDTDGDSQLTLAEYQDLWLDAMRERMVDQFQRHDDDGDGLVTVEEFGEQFTNVVERRDRNGDGVLNAHDLGRRQAPAATETE